MNDESRPAREERLRATLREGDPARAEPAPAPEEVWRMRRAFLAVLAPAGEPRRRAFWIPALATAAAAALTLAVALGFWRAHTGSAPPARETGRQAATAPAPARPEWPEPPSPDPVPERAPEGVSYAPVVAPAPGGDPPRSQAPRRPRPRPDVRPAVPEPDPPALEPMRLASALEETPAFEPDSSPPPEEPEMRQVQFAAPAGTRVIWMLSSESVVEDVVK